MSKLIVPGNLPKIIQGSVCAKKSKLCLKAGCCESIYSNKNKDYWQEYAHSEVKDCFCELWPFFGYEATGEACGWTIDWKVVLVVWLLYNLALVI